MKNIDWETAFGIEIHAMLLTKTKAFSSAKIDLNADPNTMISPIDLGYPGTKPTVNKKMVEYSYRLAKILKMKIESEIYFDRKNYFYPDLPKGYQITQFYKPIGKNGKFKICVKGVEKEITITEIHMEEDTAKQIKQNNEILFDFNRSGIPLIEIVSGHKEMNSIEDVITYVKMMRNQLIILGINDGKMQNGSFRVDVNVSIRPKNSSLYGTRTEIKNLNSFKNIEKSLKIEIERHKEFYIKNKKIPSTTVRYDENNNLNIPMRKKDSNLDYNFIPEGNISPIIITSIMKKDFDEKSKNDIKIFNFKNEWRTKMNDDELNIILSSKKIFDTFLETIKINDEKDVINFFTNNLKFALNDFEVEKIKLNSLEISELIFLKKEKKIDNKKLIILIKKMFRTSILEDIKKIKNSIFLNEEKIIEIIKEIIDEEMEIIKKDIFNRPEKIIKMLMGKTMAKTKGKANPKVINELIKDILWKKVNQ